MPKKEGEKSRKKNSLVTWLVVIGVIAIAAAIIISKVMNSGSGVTAEVAQCIGQHSAIYVQLGCHFCAQQESLFGDTYKYLNSTDCYYNPDYCNNLNITGTPTWIINNQRYLGVQSIDKLKELTGC